MRRLAASVVVAVVLLAAQPADAAVVPSAVTWERLAGCESGGNWQARGRYSGGLGFDRGTWRGVGGAGLAWQASREEQIRRATILWSQRGWRPWPACSRRLRLR